MAKQKQVLIRNRTKNTLIADSAEVADSGGARRRGLLGRDGLSDGEALWIVPCEGVHTWWMRFPIDLVYLDRRRKVRKLRKAMPPWRLSFCLLAHSVIELPAGAIEKTGTCKGDQLEISG